MAFAARRRSAFGLLAFVLVSCETLTGPQRIQHAVFVTSGESGEIVVIDRDIPRLMTTIGPLPRMAVSSAVSPDGGTVYVAAGDANGQQLVALDASSARIRWREQLYTPSDLQPSRFGGVGVSGEAAIGVSQDGTRIIMANSRHGDTLGVAILDASTRSLLGFVGPLFVQSMTLIPSSAASQAGRLAIVGRRNRDAQPRVDQIYFLDPITMQLVDSASLSQRVTGGAVLLFQVLVDRDGMAFIRGSWGGAAPAIVKYDPQTKSVVASVTVQFDGRFVLARDGRVYQTHERSLTANTTSLVDVYDASLRPLPSLETPSIDGRAPPLVQLTVTPDGSQLFVTSGTGSRTLDIPVQKGWLLVFDLARQRYLRSIDLNEYAPFDIIAR